VVSNPIDAYEINKLSTVHDAMNAAVHEAREAGKGIPMATITIRAPHDLKANAMEICGQHGVDVSSFLRKCLERLVSDYDGNHKES
jgi:hypothetical protein